MQAAWPSVATAPNVPVAHVFVALLQEHGIECRVEADTALLGESRSCRILVAPEASHRARRVLDEARFSDAELEFLATGQHSCDDAASLKAYHQACGPT